MKLSRSHIALIVLTAVSLSACGGSTQPPTGSLEAPGASLEAGVARTFQAEVEQTAAWVGTEAPTLVAELLPSVTPLSLPAFTQSPAPSPQIAVPALGSRRGDCVTPAGFILHERIGLCMAASLTWSALSVDSGVASSLGTTDGQALLLEHSNGAGGSDCQVLVFLTSSSDVLGHLQLRYEGIERRADIVSISPIEVSAFGGLAALGFTWERSDGVRSATYADLLGPSRLVHLSFEGLACESAGLFSVLDTLRFN